MMQHEQAAPTRFQQSAELRGGRAKLGVLERELAADRIERAGIEFVGFQRK
jgi:hypothetical protein